MNDLEEQTNFLILVFCLFILSHFFLYEAASQLFVYSQQSSMWKRAVGDRKVSLSALIKWKNAMQS